MQSEKGETESMDQNGVSFEARVESRLGRVEEILERVEQRLFGNHQPGELDKIQTRLTALEEFKWKLAGGTGTALFLYEIAKTVFHH